MSFTEKIEPSDVSENGFSLLEVLIALVIVSLTTLALFQSFRQLSSVSDKSIKAVGLTLDKYSERELFHRLVKGITPQWETQSNFIFSGEAKSFKGLTTGRFFSQRPNLHTFEVVIEYGTEADIVMAISIDQNRISYPLPNAADPQLFYLGWDQTWYSKWPPEDVPSTGYFDDAKFIQMPQLPIAIKLADTSSSANGYFIASIKQPLSPPFYNPILGSHNAQ